MTISTVISYYQAQWNQKAFKKRFGENVSIGARQDNDKRD